MGTMLRASFIACVGALAAGCPGDGNFETCGDSLDNDNDGLTDCEDPACEDEPECLTGGDIVCDDGLDDDGDGDRDCADEACVDDPACETAVTSDDPEDLPPGGDPALDLETVQVIEDDGDLVVLVDFHAATSWRPDFYSFFCTIELVAGDGTTTVAEVTNQHHDGVDDVLVSGVPATSVTVEDPPEGPVFRFTGVPTFAGFRVESGMLETEQSTFVSDTLTGPGGAPIPFP